MHELVAAALDHHERRDCAFGEILADHLVPARRARELRREAGTIERCCAVGERTARELDQSRQNVDERGGLAHAPRGEALRRMHDERNAARRLEEIHFVPEPALAEHVAVIGEQQHDGIAGEARIGECVEQHADLVVDVGDCAIVRAARGPHLRLGHGLHVQTAHVAQAARMRVELLGAIRTRGMSMSTPS